MVKGTEVGSTIKNVRWMTDDESSKEGWDIESRKRGIVFDMEGGGKIFASMDDEGNGPGVFLGETAEGQSVYIRPEVESTR